MGTTPQFLQMVGREVGNQPGLRSLLGKTTFHAIQHADDLPNVRAAIGEAMATGALVNYTYAPADDTAFVVIRWPGVTVDLIVRPLGVPSCDIPGRLGLSVAQEVSQR